LAAPDESSTVSVHALRPPSGPRSIVLDVGGPIARTAVPGLCERVRVLLAGRDVDVVTCEIGGLTNLDAVAVDALARLQLTARRLGRSIRLRHVRPDVQDLLALTGLCEQLPCGGGLRVEPHRQIEQREQVRVDEEVDPADPPV
jgi:anti-anti-sigma regulatory factor